MRIPLLPEFDESFDPRRAAGAGLVAAAAYVLEMYADIAISGSQSDDLLMLGRPLTGDAKLARVIGASLHFGFGTAVGLAYGAFGRQRLGGAAWWRGVKMLMIENAALWPLAVLTDRYHPAMRSGELPRLNTPVPFAQQLARHVAFGYVLGVVYGDGAKGN